MTSKEDDQENWGLKIGGNVNAGRDFIGRDKNISVAAGGTNVEGDMTVNNQTASEREKLFEDILKKIDQRPNASSEPEQTAYLKEDVQKFKAEAEKGETADETVLGRLLYNIKNMAPDIGEVLAASILGTPAAAFALVVKKVAERATKSQGNQTGG